MKAMIENWNRITGADYTEEDFKWDLHNGDKSAVFFQRGWNASESEAKNRLAEIVAQYDSAPDGDLGKGFTNGTFLKARAYLESLSCGQSCMEYFHGSTSSTTPSPDEYFSAERPR